MAYSSDSSDSASAENLELDGFGLGSSVEKTYSAASLAVEIVGLLGVVTGSRGSMLANVAEKGLGWRSFGQRSGRHTD